MGEEEKRNPKTGLDLEVEPSNESINHKMGDTNQLKERFSTSSSKNTNANIHTAKSCKGLLFYSSHFKDSLCVGLSRSLPDVPQYTVGESNMEASKKVRSLRDFCYACSGYSLHNGRKKEVADRQETQKELPVCFGFEVIVDQSAPAPAPSPTHNREADGNGLPQRRTHKPTHSTVDELLSRFKRNASLVANGVAKDVHKVGNRIKGSVDDILDPYRRRPK